MQPHFLYHLLGTWLLLIQLPRGVPGQIDEMVKVCGREYVRLVLEVCGSSYRKRIERGLRLGISSEHMAEPSSILLEDLESTLSESHPSLRGLQQSAPKDANLMPEEFKRNLPPRRDEDENDSIPELQLIFDKQSNEAENNENESLPKLQNLVFDKHSRKKRQVNMGMSSRCCFQGCTRRELFAYC